MIKAKGGEMENPLPENVSEQALERFLDAPHSLDPKAVLAFAKGAPEAYRLLERLDGLGEGLRESVLDALVANRRVYRKDPSRYEAMVKAIARRPDLSEEVAARIVRREMGGIAPVAELWKNPRLRDYPHLRRRVAESLAATVPSWVEGIEELILSVLEEYPDLARLALSSAPPHLLAHLLERPRVVEEFWKEVLDVLPKRGSLKLLATLARGLKDPQRGAELLERVAEGEAKEVVKRNLLVNQRLPIEWRRELLGERPSLEEAFLFLPEDPETTPKLLEGPLEELPDGAPALKRFLENLGHFPSKTRECVIAKASPEQLSHIREWGFDLASLLETVRLVLRHHPQGGLETAKRLLLHAFSVEAMAKDLTPEVLRQALEDLASASGKLPQGLLPGIAREAELSPENFRVLVEVCPEEEREAFLSALAENPNLPEEAIEFLASLDSPPESVYFNTRIPLSEEAMRKALEKGEIRLLAGRYDLPPEVVEGVLERAVRAPFSEMSSVLKSLLASGAPLSPRSLELLLESRYGEAVLAALRVAIYVPEVRLGSVLRALDYLSREEGMRVDHFMGPLRGRLGSAGIAEEVLGI